MSNDESNRESVIPGSAVSGLGTSTTMVKCITCGFLALRPRVSYDHSTKTSYAPNVYYEAADYARKQVQLDSHCPEGFVGPIKTYPVCFRRAASLTSETNDHLDEFHGSIQRATELVINKDRICKEWYQHTPGLNPKEHLINKMASELELERRKFELELFRMSQKVQEDSKVIADATRKITWWIGFIAIVLTLAQIVLGVLSYLSSKRPVYVPVPVIQQSEPKEVPPISQ